MRWRWILGLLLGYASLINAQFTAVLINNNGSTSQPLDPPITGKLSQFRGFNTPRPLPTNANLMYASIWASWSAWSFCAGKVQVRVRACNTVRGYSCPGPNRETKPCDIPSPRQDETEGKKSNVEYDAHEPWESDRREALKQLYSDYDTNSGTKQKLPSQDFKRQLSAGKTVPDLNQPIAPPVSNSHSESSDGRGNPPSMTPELLYERKPVVNQDILKKPVVFASKNVKESQNIVDVNIPDSTTKQPILITKSAKNKSFNSKIRDNESVSAGEIARQDQLNRLSFTRPPPNLTPTSNFPRQITQSTSRLVSSSFVSSTQGTTQKPVQGDHVKISSSVQQHFKEPSSNSKAVSSIAELKLRDGSNTSSRLVQSHIEEQPLSKALEPNTLRTKRPVVARRPTEEEIEKMATQFENKRLSGEAGELKEQLHSGEIVHENIPTINEETAKALEWMLKNMSQATEIASRPSAERSQTNNFNPIKSLNFHRVFASKILPERKIDRQNSGEVQIPTIPNPDEDEKQLESELIALKENMKQMETELNQLREAEVNSQQPQFNARKAMNLNLVPKGPKGATIVEEQKPSELFLLEQHQHSTSARWSDWGPYGECFCGKRVRTRNCIYEDPAHSEGCDGKSYESIRCIGGRPCPNERKHLSISRRVPTQNASPTIVGHFHPSTGRYHLYSSMTTTTEQPPHGNLFYPNPLPMSKRQA